MGRLLNNISVKRRRARHSLRFRWIVLLPLLLLIEAFVIYMHIHDVIMVVSLHLNIKLEWIRGLEDKCSVKIEAAQLEQEHRMPDPAALEERARIAGLPLCPEYPDALLGKLALVNETSDVDLPQLERNYSSFVESGGSGRPRHCQPRMKVAVIVPHRNREQHLRLFLHSIHPVMQRQQLDYRIVVVHQQGTGTFNKAMLLNVGYVEALKREPDIDCFVFHDVDLLPEDDRNLYRCSQVPRHLSVGIDKWDYQLPYDALFGGVIAMGKNQFAKVNGYSNEYWGWGAEDDDMYVRILHSCLGLERANYEYAKYRMVYHHSDTKNRMNPYRYTLLVGAAERQPNDGLSSLRYRLHSAHSAPLYTNFTVDVGEPSLNQKMKSFGTGIDLAVSISLLILMILVTGFACCRSRLPHVMILTGCSRSASSSYHFDDV